MATEATAATAEPADPETLLAWERRWRAPAVAAAALGLALPVAAAVVQASVAADAPEESTGQLLFIDEHSGELLAIVALGGLGAIAIGAVLVYLYRATKGRRPQLMTVALFCAIAGPLLRVGGQAASQLIIIDGAAEFASTGSQTYEEAQVHLEGGGFQTALAIGFGGQLALGFAFIVIALNAMRAGLLTRFIGVLGIIVGVLTVVPLGSPVPIVQAFWLGALALLIAHRWPAGMPPAWETGRAEPWPSMAEMREQAAREREERGEPEEEPADEAARSNGSGGDGQPAPKSHPRSKKRKRKRRR